MLLVDGGGLLSPESVRLMITGDLTPEQRDASTLFLEGAGWATAAPFRPTVRYGWVGGTGTTAARSRRVRDCGRRRNRSSGKICHVPQIGYFEAVAYRVRGFRGGELVVDSSNVHLLRGEGESVPVFCFPRTDVRGDRLPPAAVRERRPGWVSVEWNAVNEWFAEDGQLFGHARDLYHRIDVYPSTRRVRVLREGMLLAETRRSRVLFETALPPRYYLPIEDVRAKLVPSPTKTRCAYKGSASYWSVAIGDRIVEDLLWTYAEPQLDALPVRDLVCFFNERVDLEVDGDLQERPRTQWSRDDDS